MPRLFLLLFFVLAGVNITYSQSLLSKQIVLEKKSGTIKELLDEISLKGGFSFSYSNIPFSDSVNLTFHAATVRGLLQSIFKGKNISFNEHKDFIILKPSVQRQNVELRGYVFQKETSEPIPGAHVFFPDNDKAVISDQEGKFSVILPPGFYEIGVSHVSFEKEVLACECLSDTTLNVFLLEKAVNLSNIIINEKKPGEIIRNLEMSRNVLDVNYIKSIPALFGEVDVMRSLQYLPGVQTGGDFNTGLNVRGGAADQSLIQLNGATLYNPQHLGGLFSVLNHDIINEVEIYKGNIPSRMGGRLSSIFNAHLKTGNKQTFKGSAGIGIISSRAYVEGPIIKDRASFILSARRTYMDFIFKLSRDKGLRDVSLYFFDVNANLDFNLNSKNRITVSSYTGSDAFKMADIIGFDWGNKVSTLQWDYAPKENLLVNTKISYTKFNYRFLVDAKDELEYVFRSNIQELNAKVDFDLKLSNISKLNFGYQSVGYSFSPAYIEAEDYSSNSGVLKLDDKYGLEQALFVGHEYVLSEKLSINYGLRYSTFQNIGPGHSLNYANTRERSLGEVTDTLFYRKGETIHTYHGPEPRFVARYIVNSSASIKWGYSRMRQNIHMVSSTTAGQPVERWISSDRYVKPQMADQLSIGYFKNFEEDKFETSVEVYYRYMQNQIDIKEHSVFLEDIQGVNGSILSNYMESSVLSGIAWAYGSEFFVRKNAGILKGLASYTWSRARRQISGINNGMPYSPRYDLTHSLALTMNFNLGKKFNIGASWIYNTGNAVTLPVGKFVFEGQELPYYAPGQRNNHRLPPYHRMDVSVSYTPKPYKKKWNSSWNVSVYNAYMRKNPVMLFFTEVINGDPEFDRNSGAPIVTRELKPVMFFISIIPSLSYNVNF